MMRRVLALCAALSGLWAGQAAAQVFDNLSDHDRAALEAEIRAYLLANPELVFEMAEIVNARRAEEQVAAEAAMVRAFSAELFDDPSSWVGGNPDGDVTVVEFLDYRCSYCKKAHDEVQALVGGDGNIRYIIKEFPILGPESVLGARAALAVLAVAPAAFPQFHDRLMRFDGPLNEVTIGALVAETGGDADAIRAAMTGESVTSIIAANHALAQALSVDGTPLFVIGDRLQRGYAPLSEMQATVEAVRAGS
jgi:protein-disulfide isomerase